jgi:hypothetical protein
VNRVVTRGAFGCAGRMTRVVRRQRPWCPRVSKCAGPGRGTRAWNETRGRGVKRRVNTTLATINSTAALWWMCTRGGSERAVSRSKCGMAATRGEGKGGTPEINLAGSAFYGNPGCHGGPIGKYNKADGSDWIARRDGCMQGRGGSDADEEMG